MSTETLHWVSLGIFNIPLYICLGWFIFGDLPGFFECVRFWLTPDVISWIRGEWNDAHWGALKLFVFFALCVGTVYWEYHKFYGNPVNPSVPLGLPNPSTQTPLPTPPTSGH